MAHHVVAIVGSLRKESFALKVANALAKLAPDTLKLDVTTLHGISFFNQDLEAAPPADWLAFREKLQKSNGVLFVTPEYNRSVPGVLKNAIDVGSRPYGQSVWDGKPGAVIIVSPGAVGGAARLFDDKGNLTNPGTREFLGKFMQAFAAWSERNGKK